MNSAVYGIGFLIILVGIIYVAHLMHIPQTYIIGISIILVGVGVISALQNGKRGA